MTTTAAPPPPPPPPPPPAYAPAPAAAMPPALLRRGAHRRLFVALGAGLGVLVLVVVLVSVATRHGSPGSCVPPGCAPPPVAGPPVVGTHHYQSSDFGFTVDYSDFGSLTQNADEQPDALVLDYPDIKGGPSTLQFQGVAADGRTAQQMVEDVVAEAIPGAQLAYVIPNAMVGYRPGYGAVYDYYPQSGNGTAEQQRLVVIAAVKDDLAIVSSADGAYYPFTQDGINAGHPSALDSVIGLFFDDPNNTVQWPGDPRR